ncbi:MAG: polymorphic toxin type 10 domain-containing protein [Steroidobacteraceae bacterium]
MRQVTTARPALAMITCALAFATGAGWAGEPAMDAAPATVAAAAAGRTAGSFDVTSTGAATYRIPIWTPPGAGAIGADLALIYNSRAGNGVAGVGWSLSGLSAITRCNRTIAQDGVPAAVSNTGTDRYCLDGQQLKLVAGVAGQPGATYSTEVESRSRVVANGIAGGGPASFTVSRSNGLTYEYGATPDARIYAGATATVRTWALSGVRDRAGNSLAVTYVNEAAQGAYTNGTFRVASVEYPRTATGQGPYYRVSFAYSPRPANDPLTGYLAGAPVTEPNRLDSVSVTSLASGAVLRSYRLGYASGTASGRQQLTSIQECGPGACLEPTMVSYQQGAQGWSPYYATTSLNAAYKAATRAIDMNGDGLADLLHPVGLGNGKMSWRVAFSQGDGYGSAVDTGVTADASAKIIVGRFLGNGRYQFLLPQGGYWTLVSWNGSAFDRVPTGIVQSDEYLAADLDGDGLDDLLSATITMTVQLHGRRNLTVPAPGGAIPVFASTRDLLWETTGVTPDVGGYDNVADLNGDGRADVAIRTFNNTKRSGSWITPLLSNGFGTPMTVGVRREFFPYGSQAVVDWNADGCSDLVQVSSVLISNCAGDFREVALAPVGIVQDAVGSPTVLAADWDSDGRSDLLYVSSASGKSPNTWYVIRSTGTGGAAPVGTGVPAPNSTAWLAADVDGDAQAELLYRDDGHNGSLRYHKRRLPGVAADLATSFSDGYGIGQSVSYVSIASDPAYVRSSGAVFPEVDYRGPLQVVKSAVVSDGTGGNYTRSFEYQGARIHVQGRGFEGFETMRERDSRDGTQVEMRYLRAFPHTGTLIGRRSLTPNGTTPLVDWAATADRRPLGSGTEQRMLTFLSGTRLVQYETGGTLDGQPVAEVVEASVWDDYGNRTRLDRTITDRDPGSPFKGGAWSTTVMTSYATDAANHCLDIPSSVAVTQSVPGQPARTRTTAYTVDPVACRVTGQVVEPGTPALRVATTFGFDACGNLSSVQVVGSTPAGTAMPTRTRSYGYGSRCQLPETMTDALGQTTRVGYDYDRGLATSVTDPNGITTRWDYDEFGRRLAERRPDGTTTAWSYESCRSGPCWGAADLRLHVYETSKGATGAIYDQRERLYDGFDRMRSHQYMRVQGVWVAESVQYDALGRPVMRALPTSSGSNGSTAWSYDLLGRVTSQRLLQPGGAVDRAYAIQYSGRRVQVTDPLGRTRARISDVSGRLRRVVDPAPGGTTSYDYDAFGGLVRIQDPGGAVSAGTYNLRGFRTQWTDADRGAWTYSGNSLNELLGWTDARGQAFSITRDALGRVTSRTEPEGTSTWTWGTSAALHDIGRLRAVSGYGYSESLAYDGYGRLAARTITTDQAYRYDYSYDPNGALDTLAYPSSPVPAGQSGDRYTLQFGYSYGSVVRIADVTGGAAPGRVLWSLQSANDAGQVTAESLGTGLVTVANAYRPVTLELTSRQAGISPSASNRQNLAYQWDAAGNLSARRDVNRSLVETFSVDALDRVQSSTLNGVPNFAASYDASGNVLSRSDAGVYAYGDPSHPHAVTAAGGRAYTYDANGNQITRDGASQAWASFNLPVQLAQPIGGVTYQSRFSYGPDRQRWKQVASYSNGTETTHYVGGLLEKEHTTSTGRTYWRHYVPLPSGLSILVSRNSDGTASTGYVLTDHLGSTDTVLDASGSVVAQGGYGAFGGRRAADGGAGAPDWAGIANTTRHGYTGHEHLDNLALVHMNGRVYDPTLGRFLSVDPLIGDPGDSQQLNPYAYVGNRPLTAVDPTGHELVCAMVCTTIVNTVVASLSGYFGPEPDPKPPATALPGQSAQTGTAICGPGQTSSACTGSAPGGATPGGSSTLRAAAQPDPDYARENLEQFLRDLGFNAVDVLLLSAYHDATDTLDAFEQGDFVTAAVLGAMTVCDVAKPCQGVAKGGKAARASVRELPETLARVIPGKGPYPTLGPPGRSDVFVTAADDIAGLDAEQLARRLGIPSADTFTVVRFRSPSTGIASPVFRSDPGFIGGGVTSGGAREFVIPNGPIPPDATIEVLGR